MSWTVVASITPLYMVHRSYHLVVATAQLSQAGSVYNHWDLWQPGRETGSVVHQAVMEQDQVNREQEELDRTQDNLTFSEVLHLLSKKAVLGRGIPEKYDIPPWRLPHTQQHSNQINNLVQHSMMAQAAHIPHSGDFADFVLSNAR